MVSFVVESSSTAMIMQSASVSVLVRASTVASVAIHKDIAPFVAEFQSPQLTTLCSDDQVCVLQLSFAYDPPVSTRFVVSAVDVAPLFTHSWISSSWSTSIVHNYTLGQLLSNVTVCSEDNLYCASVAPSVRWLNASSAWNVEIRRRGFNSRTYQIRADEPLILHAVVVSPRNISREHQQSLHYVWTLRNENGSIIPMISASTNPMVLHVPPGILLTGHHYAVDVEVWDLSPRLATVVHKAETTLITRWQPYLVLRWPASTRISMPLGSAAVVNVTLVDGNVHPVADASLHIDVNMSWTCRWEDTSVCPNAVNISSRWASTKWKPLNGSSLNSHQATVLLTIHLDTSIPTLIGQFMVVCVELSYDLPSDDGSSSSPQRIQRTERLVIDVVGHTNPMLFVQPTAATQLRQTTRVLPSFAEVQVLSNSTPSCNWQLVYPRTMALKSSLRRSTSPPSNSSWLTLGPLTSAFTAYRDTSSLLTFRVTCDATATEFDVYQNSPPYGGRLLRVPQVGVALSTLFHLEAPLWRDDAVDDYPLRYVFAISDSLENEWWTLPSHIYEPFVEDILLPQLIVAATSSMRIYQMHRLEVSVQDNWGAIAVATTNISLRNSSAFSGTAAAEHASYWTALSLLLHHGIDAKGSAQVLVTNATYPRQQRAVAVLATVSSMVFATSSATASSSKMFSQASTFLKHDWESFWNRTVAVSDLTPSPATSDAAVATEADLIDAWSLQYEYVALYVSLQLRKQQVWSVLGPQVANISALVASGSFNASSPSSSGSNATSTMSAAAAKVLQAVQSAVTGLSSSMTSLLMSYLASSSSNSGSGTVSTNDVSGTSTVLQAATLWTELVQISIALVAFPTLSASSSATALATVTVPTASAPSGNTSSSSPVVTVTPPSVSFVQSEGVVGMIVSVVSLAPSVLSSSGSVAVKNSSLVSGSGSTNAGDTKYIEQPKLVSDVVTLQVLYASTNGSTTRAPLPVFQVNLTLHSTSSSSSSSGSSNASTTWLRHNCTLGVEERVSLRCADSRVVFNLTCSGRAVASVKRQCPVPRTVCSILDLDANTVVSNDYCEARVSGSSVSCKCGYDASSSSDGNSSLSSSLLALKGKVSVAAFSSFAAGDLDSSVSSVVAVSFSGDVASRSTSILAAFGCVWGMGLLLMAAKVVSWSSWDTTQKKPIAQVIDGATNDAAANDGSPGNPRVSWWQRTWHYLCCYCGRSRPPAVAALSTDENDAEAAVYRDPTLRAQVAMLRYVLSFQSLVFRYPGWSSMARFGAVMAAHHPYLRVFLYGVYLPSYDQSHDHRRDEAAQKRTLLNIVQLLTQLTISCFVLAVLYDLQYPTDDGYCESQDVDRSTCEYRKTLLDPWSSRCHWVPPVDDSASSTDGSANVAAVLTESLYGNVMRRVVVRRDATNDGETTPVSSCRLNSDNTSLIAFIFSFAITSAFSSVLDFVLDAVFRVLLLEADFDADDDNDDDDDEEDTGAVDRKRGEEAHGLPMMDEEAASSIAAPQRIRQRRVAIAPVPGSTTFNGGNSTAHLRHSPARRRASVTQVLTTIPRGLRRRHSVGATSAAGAGNDRDAEVQAMVAQLQAWRMPEHVQACREAVMAWLPAHLRHAHGQSNDGEERSIASVAVGAGLSTTALPRVKRRQGLVTGIVAPVPAPSSTQDLRPAEGTKQERVSVLPSCESRGIRLPTSLRRARDGDYGTMELQWWLGLLLRDVQMARSTLTAAPEGDPKVLADAEAEAEAVSSLLWRSWERSLEAQGLQPCGVPRIGIVWRALSVAVIVALNAGALYFIITKAVVRGLAWQTAYLKVCGWEWFTEVLILDVVDVTLLDFVVPQALRRRVFAGLWRLLATMRQELTINPNQVAVDSKHPRGEMTTSDEDVLAALVKQRPDLWESTLISRSSHLSSRPRRVDEANGASSTSVVALPWWLRWFASLPAGVGYGLLRFTSLMVVTWIIYVWYAYVQVFVFQLPRTLKARPHGISSIALAVFSLVVLVLFGIVAWHRYTVVPRRWAAIVATPLHSLWSTDDGESVMVPSETRLARLLMVPVASLTTAYPTDPVKIVPQSVEELALVSPDGRVLSSSSRSSRQRTSVHPSSMPQPFSPGGSRASNSASGSDHGSGGSDRSWSSFSDEEFLEQSISDEPDDSLSPHARSGSQRSRSPVVSSSRSSDESASSASSSFESFDSFPTDA